MGQLAVSLGRVFQVAYPGRGKVCLLNRGLLMGARVTENLNDSNGADTSLPGRHRCSETGNQL